MCSSIRLISFLISSFWQKCKLLKAKKEEGNETFKVGKFQEAYDLYTEALAVDPLNVNTNAKIYCNRATVSSKVRLSGIITSR